MRRSEIFDSFVKIAQEKGLISDDKPTNERVEAEHSEKDFHETNPRHDSLSIEQISKLYGNKPKTFKAMEYKKNIMEIAHPEMEVLFQAHDKLNGLIENEMEGQNIRIHISLKEPDGHLTQRKYAEMQLVNNLVRVANDLDNRNQDKLCKLADVCLLQASSLKKQAFWPLIAGIGTAIGTLYVQQHLNFHSDGFEADYQKTINEIDDLLTSNTNFGVGVSYQPEFIQEMNKLKSDLGTIHAAVAKASPIIMNMEKPRTASEKVKEMARIAQDPKTQEATQAITELSNVIKEYGPEISAVINNFQRQSYKDEVTADKGALTKLVDWTEILHGGGGSLVSDDFLDVKRALVTLWKDIVGLQTAVIQASKIEQNFVQQAEQTPEASPEASPETPSEGEKSGEGNPLAGVEEGIQGLLGGLGK
jgi:hypothetical protein